jgi:hypothetical protein
MKHPTVIGLVLIGACAFFLPGFLIRYGGTKKRPTDDAQRARADHSPTVSRLTKAEEIKSFSETSRPCVPGALQTALARTPEEIAELARQMHSLPKNPKSETKIAAFFKAWATLDANAAFAVAKSFPPELRSDAIHAVLDGADASVAGSLATSINELSEGSLSPSAKSSLLGRAVGKWSRVDPVAAAKFLDSSDERGMNFAMAWNEVASNWAAIDPVAALDWARQAAKDSGRFAMSGAITGWWKNDPPAAEAYVASHLATLGDWQLASALAANMFSEDPERAKKWVSQLPNEEARKQAVSMLAIQWGFSDPAAATKWSATLPAAEERARLPWSSPWAHGRTRDPAAAANGSALTMAPAVIRRCKTSLQVASKDPRRRSHGSRRFPIPNFGPPNSKSPVTGCGKIRRQPRLRNSPLLRRKRRACSPESGKMKRWIPTLIVVSLAFAAGVLFFKRNDNLASGSSDRAKDAIMSSFSGKISPGHRLTKSEEDRLLLGDIAAVPFQELYTLLSKRTSDEIAKLAEQLQTLPRSRASEAKVAAFFKTWAALDAKAALASAIALREAHFRSVAIAVVLRSADAIRRACLPAHSINDLPPGAYRLRLNPISASSAVTKWSSPSRWPRRNSWMQSTPKGSDYTSAISAATNWASQDPVAALAWAQQTSRRLTAILPCKARSTAGGKGRSKSRLSPRRFAARRFGPAGNGNASFADTLFVPTWHARQWSASTPALTLGDANSAIAQSWAQDDPEAATRWRPTSARRAACAVGVSGAVLGRRRSERG